MKRAATFQTKLVKVQIAVETDKRINFQAIDPRIDSDLWDRENVCCIDASVTVPEEAVEEIIKKLKQHPNIIMVNKELTKTGEKLKKEADEIERRNQERKAIFEKIKGTHIEVFVEATPSDDCIPFTEIDSRIIDIGTTGRPANLVVAPPKKRMKCFNPGPRFPSVFVPKEAAEEIIAKLKQSQYIFSVNGEPTKQGAELKPKEVNTVLPEKNLLFSYRQCAKNYTKVAVGVLGTVAVGLYIANRMKV